MPKLREHREPGKAFLMRSSLNQGFENPGFGKRRQSTLWERCWKRYDLKIKKKIFPMMSLHLRMSFLGANLIVLSACIKPFHDALRIKPKLISVDYNTLRFRHLQGIWRSFLHSYFPLSLPPTAVPAPSPLFLKDLGMLFILTGRSSATLPSSTVI